MNKLNLHVVMPMAGEGQRFKKEGYAIAKPLIEIDGMTIYEKALSSLDDFSAKHPECNISHTFIVREEFKEDNIGEKIHSIFPDANIIYVEKTTNGALETSYLAVPYIKDDEGVILMDCDMYFQCQSFVETVKQQLATGNPNPCLLTFDETNPRFSYVSINENGFAKEVVEKQPISNNAILGCYFAGSGHLFKTMTEKVIEDWHDKKIESKEIYTSLLFNVYSKTCSVNVIKIDESKGEHYVSMGTPEEFEKAKTFFNSTYTI